MDKNYKNHLRKDMELKSLVENCCKKIDKRYCYTVYEKDFSICLSKPIVMPIPIQQKIGELLFSYSENHDYFGIKAGSSRYIQCFNLEFTENFERFYIRFYLPLKQNWEEYTFIVKGDKLECLSYPTHIEKREKPDISIVTECVIETLKNYLKNN